MQNPLIMGQSKIGLVNTTSMTISIPEGLKAFVENRVRAGGFEDASDDVRDLLLQDEARAAEERLKALIQEGLDSPRSTRAWEEMRADWTARIKAAKHAAPR